jgi:hypothetical protein
MVNATICAKDHLSGSLACKRWLSVLLKPKGYPRGRDAFSLTHSLTLTRPKYVITVLTSLLNSLSAMLSVARLSHDFDRC